LTNTPLLHSALYHRPLSSGRDTSAALASGPLLPSGHDSILRANTPLLYSALYHRPLSSGRDPLVVLASRPFSRATSVLLLSVANLSLRAALYCSLALQPLLAAIAVLAVRTYPTSAKRLK
jgi:hypothetical protein